MTMRAKSFHQGYHSLTKTYIIISSCKGGWKTDYSIDNTQLCFRVPVISVKQKRMLTRETAKLVKCSPRKYEVPSFYSKNLCKNTEHRGLYL